MGTIPTHLYPLRKASGSTPGLILVDHNNLNLLRGFDLNSLRQKYKILSFQNWWFDSRLNDCPTGNYFFQQKKLQQSVSRHPEDFSLAEAFEVIDALAVVAPAVLEKLSLDSGLNWEAKAFEMTAFNLIDSNFWRSTNHERPILFALGAFAVNCRKNLLWAVNLISRLERHMGFNSKDPYEVVFFYHEGEPKLIREVRKRLRDLNAKVRILRRPSIIQIRHLLRSSQIFVHGSWADAGPRAINEALSAGAHVVQYNADWAAKNPQLQAAESVFLTFGIDLLPVADFVEKSLAREPEPLRDMESTYRGLDQHMRANFSDWETGGLISNPHFGKNKLYDSGVEFQEALEDLLSYGASSGVLGG